MMKASNIVLTLFLFFGFTLTNCKTNESCPPVEGAFFDIQGIGSLLHHYRVSETASPPLENNAAIPFESYHGLILKYSVNYLSSNFESKSNAMPGQLYALSCIQNGEAGSKHEAYENITVITLNDFNDQYSSGDTINDLLKIGHQQTIDDFLSAQESKRIRERTLFFELIEPPSANNNYQVLVTVALNTGEMFSKESTTVEFN